MSHPAHIRRKVYEKYNGHCAYCGCELQISKFDVDHFLPDRQDNRIENLMPSCRECNLFKSDLSIEDFRMMIRGLPLKMFRENANIRFLSKYSLVIAPRVKVVFHYETVQNQRKT